MRLCRLIMRRKETMKSSYSIYIIKASHALLFFLFLVSASCDAPQKPVDFKMGEHQCAHCMMGITDIRFRGEAITHKGKIYHFDSIECLTAWVKENHQHPGSAWVANFLKQGEWIDMNKAIFLHSEKLNSPMGAGLSAYETEAQFIEARQMYGGDRMNRSELEAYIANWQNRSSNPSSDSGVSGHEH